MKAKRVQLYDESVKDGDYDHYQAQLVVLIGRQYGERVAILTMYHGPMPYNGEYSATERINERVVYDATHLSNAALIRAAIESFDLFQGKFEGER